jgi:hypothetical protein
MGMTSVDLMELAPHYRPGARRDPPGLRADRQRCRFENLHGGDDWWAGWLNLFHDLVKMLARSQEGERPGWDNPG